jgi:adenine phosphoribosyltransferase
VKWLRDHIRAYADFPKAGVIYQDINPLFQDPKALKRVILALSAPFVQESFHGVVAIEARGFLFGVLVAQALEVPCILVL